MKAYASFPSTRFLGSKRKLLPALAAVFESLSFETACDPFCGSGAVSYLLKSMDKKVFASDMLGWNVRVARALLSQEAFKTEQPLNDAVNAAMNAAMNAQTHSGFVETNFENVFFTTEENRFIDAFVNEIAGWAPGAKDAAYFALFQSLLAKRPYNLFHRANLYMRLSDVKRSFGNKATWDTPFDTLIPRYAAELAAARFCSAAAPVVSRQRAEEVDYSKMDLVYLDPPYVSKSGAGVDYLDYYHFLEGLSLEDTDTWAARLLPKYKHKPLTGRGENPWCHPQKILGAFDALIEKCKTATVVISYRNDGIPTIAQLEQILVKHGKTLQTVDCGNYIYALSKNTHTREVILIGR